MNGNLIEKIYQLYEFAKKSRAEIDKDWQTYYNFYIGKHHREFTPSTKKDIALNYCFSTIETIVPIMTDNRPRIYVIPEERTDEEAAKLADAIMEWSWYNLGMPVKLPLLIRSNLIWGTSFAKVYWNKVTNTVAVAVCDPHEIYIDPEAVAFEDCRYIIHAVVRDLAYIRRAYPETGQEVKADAGYSDTKEELEAVGDWKADINRKALILECWLKEPDELEEYIEETEKGTEIKTRQKYPNGRVITVADHKLLRDIPNPYSFDFPFVPFFDYQDPTRFWGVGEIQQIILLQKEINKRKAQIMRNSDLIANPIMIVPMDSGIDTDNLTNTPGQIISYNREAPPNWMMPPSLPPYVFTLLEQSKFELDSITGVHDVTQGRRPTGITAGIAIAELQEAAQTRIREKVRLMESSLCQLGYKILRLIHDFCTEPQILRIVGELGRYQYREFMGKDIPYDFKVQVEAGSSMPVNRYTRFQQAILLYNVKAIDQQALLEAANWPDREKIIERMKVPAAPALPMGISPTAGMPGAGIPGIPGAPAGIPGGLIPGIGG